MKAIKNIGIVAVGLAVMLLVFSLPVIFVDGAVWVSDHVLPLMQDVIAYAVLACILMIPIALIPQTLSPPEPRRPVAGGARKAHLLRRGQERALEARRAGGVPRLCDGAGRRHVAELSDAVAAGHRAVMLHVVQRGDCVGFRIAADLDPVHDLAFRDARAAGAEAPCYSCEVGLDGMEIDRPLALL